MSASFSPSADPIRAYVDATQSLLEVIDDPDHTSVEPRMRRQLDCFEHLKAALLAGSLPRTSALEEAVSEGEKALAEVRDRMLEVRGDLERVRHARVRAGRLRVGDTDARFVSRRV